MEAITRFCEARKAQPDYLFSEAPRAGPNGTPGWRCKITISGCALSAQAVGTTQVQAQEKAAKDFAQKLHLAGLINRTGKRQLNADNAVGPASAPSWAITGGAPSPFVQQPKKKGKGKGLGKGKGKGLEEDAQHIEARNIESEYGEMLMRVRAGQMDKAIEVCNNRLSHDRHSISVKRFATLVSSVGVRASEESTLRWLQTMSQLELVAFPDDSAAVYGTRFARWAVREFLADGQASLERVHTIGVQTLERNGMCIPQLQAMKGKKPLEMELCSTGPLPPTQTFTRGDWIFVTWPHTAEVGRADPAPDSKCGTLVAELITFLQAPLFGMVVRIVGASNELIEQFYGGFCRIDRAANHVTFSRQIDALSKLCGPPKELVWLRQILLAADDPSGPGKEAALCQQYHGGPGCPNRFDLLGMANPSQLEALKAGTSRRMTLIQGPPGSGKTSTALLLMRLWIAAGRGPILASADSNVAVDNLVTGAAQAELQVVRVGRPEASRPDLDQYNLLNKAKEMGGGLKSDWTVERQILERADIVCCTCSGAAHPMLQGVKFTCVLIDEAGQATELAMLVPLLHLRQDGSAALVGDHRQLPPTVACLEADIEGLGTSLFERLSSHGVQPIMLDTQYRMHPAIAAFPAAQYYSGKLKTGVRGAMRPACRAIAWPAPWAPVVFLPVEGAEVPEGNSYLNEAEAAAVDIVLSAVINSGEFMAVDVGIITPYAAQARALRRRLGCPPPGQKQKAEVMHGVSGCEVSSVDGFQGREKELIIVSTVRANKEGKVGFVGDPRRLNVTLTRAKRGLVVVGNFATLSQDANGWRPWLMWAQERGLVAGCPPTSAEAAGALYKLNELHEDDLQRIYTCG